ncbi:GNAT family N-acetyltransferase [Humisphaera borealis]|uniref:GNAT family N-acetyltransferase n=1 Tax=Humisphaera borealis TaxID=2807512 RepID=A0A7M2WZM5_9BACT|nr:GNAT family N-acetyltransferase [Humisphaera borealis]QOV90925.1 GNAT family N-acetyltransferase [Humisphaera borealis]
MPLLLRRFQFVDHGSLVDRELELVQPQKRWIDDLLASCRDSMTVTHMPREARLSRDEIQQFLAESPLGRYSGDDALGRVPAYHFWMMLRHGAAGPTSPPPLRIAGGLSVRIGHSPAVELYYGHLGYHVFPAARGRQYALRACGLVMPLLKAHGLRTIWVTCDPQNMASRRTIERLGGQYVETVEVPMGDPLYLRGETHKQRYRIEV